MSEDEHVEVAEPCAAPFLASLGRAGLVHDTEPDALDLDAGNLGESIPQPVPVVVAPDTHQAARPAQELIEKALLDPVACVDDHVRVLDRTPHLDEVRPLVQLVAPYAPHIAEELWEKLGASTSVMDAGWPRFDAALAREDSIQLAVQVNGKLRGTIHVARDINQEAALAAAIAEPSIAKFVTSTPKKVVFVPGRLLNLVV